MSDQLKISLDAIELNNACQSREELNQQVIDEYAQNMRDGAEFPPIKVYQEGDIYWLYGGFHRVQAARNAGWTEIQAEVMPGTLEDAKWLSYSENQNHGLRRSNSDKRKAIQAALKHPQGADKSDRQLGKHCGVDHKTVGRWREELELTGEIPQSDHRTGADGRHINTENIGENSAASSEPPTELEPLFTPDDKLPAEPGGSHPSPGLQEEKKTVPVPETSSSTTVADTGSDEKTGEVAAAEAPVKSAVESASDEYPVGSAGWAQSQKEHLKKWADKVDKDKKEFTAVKEDFAACEGWQVLTGKDGKPFETMRHFARAEPPAGLGLTPEAYEFLVGSNRTSTFGIDPSEAAPIIATHFGEKLPDLLSILSSMHGEPGPDTTREVVTQEGPSTPELSEENGCDGGTSTDICSSDTVQVSSLAFDHSDQALLEAESTAKNEVPQQMRFFEQTPGPDESSPTKPEAAVPDADEILAAAERQRWPEFPLALGEKVGPGEERWQKFANRAKPDHRTIAWKMLQGGLPA